jgi:hypothetical protein
MRPACEVKLISNHNYHPLREEYSVRPHINIQKRQTGIENRLEKIK